MPVNDGATRNDGKKHLQPNNPPEYPDATGRNSTWVCYILRCSDGTLYTGVTNALDKRIAAHNAGTAAKYTRARGPVTLALVEICADKSAALKRERAIKALSRTQKLKLAQTNQNSRTTSA
jgi:putative endonuclease